MNLDQCDQIFAQVREASTPSSVCYALQQLFNHYKVISIDLNRGNVFWRARFTGQKPWGTIADMSSPPAEHANAGRLNDLNTPCLYAATHVETALQEIRVKEKEQVQLVGFKAKLETPIRIAVVGELMHVYKTGYLRLTGSDPDRSISRFLNSQGMEQSRKLLYIDAFLAHLLADAEATDSGYMLSRAVASMVYRDENIDGIMYPSVQDELGMNIALRPQAADLKIHPVCCFHAIVTRIRPFGFIEYDVRSEVKDITPDGIFVWASPLAAPERWFFNLTKEEYEIAIRDGNNPNAFMKFISVYNKER